MTRVCVRAAALASALAPDLDAAVARLAGEASAPPARNGSAARPYFAIPVACADWTGRAEHIARAVSASLRSKASLDAEAWRRMPCIVGSSSQAIGAQEDAGSPLGPPIEFAHRIARWFGAGGPVLSASSACTSGLTAMQIAVDLIAAGHFPHVLVIGIELANRLTLAGFEGLGLLSARGARPCDRERDGLVLGEALGAVLLSATGSWRIASLAGGMDASSLTGPTPDGDVIAQTMREALSVARWSPGEIGLVKLQAGGSPLGDLAEARAVCAVFGGPPRALSLKGAIGHTLGASGPAELALLLAALERGEVPQTWGFSTPDPELGIAPSGGDACGLRRLLFNLSGFGGSVATMALEKMA